MQGDRVTDGDTRLDMALVPVGYSALRAAPERTFCRVGQPVRVV
jgi:hypothetical protein